MYPRSKRTEFRKAGLQLEWLEDRQLFSGGVSLSLLQPLVPSSSALALVSTVRLTPVEVAAVLQESGNLLAANVKATIDNPHGLTLTGGAHADLAQIASINLQATARLFQPGVTPLLFSGSAWGTSGLGPVINLIFSASTGGTSGLGPVINVAGTGNVNPGSSAIPNVQVDTRGILGVGKDVNFGLDIGIGNAFGELVRPTPGEGSFPPLGSLADSAVLDLLLRGPSNAGPGVSQLDFKDTIGLAEPGVPSKSVGIDQSGPAGEDNESFAPQTDDLQDSQTPKAGSLNLLFQRIFDNMGDLGRGAFSGLAHLSWVSWLICIAIASATAGMVLHKRFRRAPSAGALPTKSGRTQESWWFSSLK
jgi:hypothetical protein